MANARERFNTLAEYLVRHREAQQGQMFGKPCLSLQGEPFMMLYRESVAFRLHGRALTHAMAVKGSSPFDPLLPDKPPPGRPGWVLIPTSQFLIWDRLAMDAMRCAREAKGKNVSWQMPPTPTAPAPEPPPSTPTSLASRVAAALSGGLLSRLNLLNRD